jgi:hypothetical protein
MFRRESAKRESDKVELNEAERQEKADEQQQRKQADILIDIAKTASLFHAPDSTCYVDIIVGGCRQTWPVRSKSFKRWLSKQYFSRTNSAPNSEAMQSALNVIEAMAAYDGEERRVFVRAGGIGDIIYIDLGDSSWRAIEIDAKGWRIADSPPVRFRRSSGMQPLPVPTRGGGIEALRRFLNVKNKGDFELAVSWEQAAYRHRGPYPVLVLAGEQGTGKTTFSGLMRSMLDPNTAPLRALPREDRDLFIAATNAHVLAFDNVSGLPKWISDTLCRLATGGGFAVRQLYTDQDEVLFDAQRPIILNGIEDVVDRPDLADRAIFLHLEPISDRKTETEIMAAFNAERPAIMGVLLDSVAHGLKQYSQTRLDSLPRMADFALWGSACEGALWKPGTFMGAYAANITSGIENIIEADLVAGAVMEFMGTIKGEVVMSPAALLATLSERVGEKTAKHSDWPKTPRKLTGQLTRIATAVRKMGVEISRPKRDSHQRLVRLAWQPENGGETPSQPSPPSPSQDFQRFRHDGSQDGCRGDDDTVTNTVTDSPLDFNGNDGHDGHDGLNPRNSASDPFAALRHPKYGLQPWKEERDE